MDDTDSRREVEELAALSATKATVRENQKQTAITHLQQEGVEATAMELDADNADNVNVPGSLCKSFDLNRYEDFLNH